MMIIVGKMAMKILSRCVQPGNLHMRICLTSSASMSSNAPSNSPNSNVTKNPIRKRESFRSILASIFGGYVDPADPNEPPIPAEKVNFPDPTETATGDAKLLLLAFENGILDPYCTLPVERGSAGTKDNPIKVESFAEQQLIACVCEDQQNFMRFSNLYMGEPRRCQCGHWMELVEAPRFWEKIPKEDLLTIPKFRHLEEDGKLDEFLKTGKL